MKLDAMAVTMPLVRDHPNRVPFEGVLTYVDVPSDRAPSGSRGRRVPSRGRCRAARPPDGRGGEVDRWAGRRRETCVHVPRE